MENDDSLVPDDDVAEMVRQINAELHRQRIFNRIDLVESGYEALDESFFAALRERQILLPHEKFLRLTPDVERAIRKAAALHAGQIRKNSGRKMPYVSHVLSVAEILARHDADETALIAGLLHDTLEDTDYTPEALAQDFGPEIRDIVIAVSEDPDVSRDRRASWEDRKHSYLRHLEQGNLRAWMVSSADKIHNLVSLAEAYKISGPSLWQNFNAPPDKKLWFYEEVYNIIKGHLEHPIVAEFAAELKAVRQLLSQAKVGNHG